MKHEHQPGQDIYGIMERDLFPDLMVTFMRIIRIYMERGFLIENFEEDDIATYTHSAKKIILIGIRMICDLTPPIIVESALELAYIVEIRENTLDTRGACELYLAKKFVLLLASNTDHILIYQWIRLYCSQATLTNVIFPMQYFDPELLRQERIRAIEEGGLRYQVKTSDGEGRK